MVYIVKNNNTGRSYPVESKHNQSIDVVWLSQKCWFGSNYNVTITAEDGISKTYTK